MCYPPASQTGCLRPEKRRSHHMRKIVAGIFLLLIASSARAQALTGATDITAAQVQAFVKDAPHDRNSDRPIRVVDAGAYRVGIFGASRPQSAPPNAPCRTTDV